MDERDAAWLAENYAALLNFARQSYVIHGRGVVAVEAPLVLGFDVMLSAGRIWYMDWSDCMSDAETFERVSNYEPCSEVLVIVVVADALVSIEAYARLARN